TEGRGTSICRRVPAALQSPPTPAAARPLPACLASLSPGLGPSLLPPVFYMGWPQERSTDALKSVTLNLEVNRRVCSSEGPGIFPLCTWVSVC
ncbi:LOW QUALITY PROTEIN: POLR2F isoform 13, partial [Pongo abelii]